MVKSLYNEILRDLRPVTPDPEFEANVIMEEAFGRGYRLKELKGESVFTPEKAAAAKKILHERLSGRPLQYAVGSWEFYGLTFRLGEGVLIPRQDTETLVDTALSLIKDIETPRVMDLCSGSGCIAAAIKSKRPDAHVAALELSPAALKYLRENLRGRDIDIIEADALDPAVPEKFNELDLIVSNPPYLTEEDMLNLQPEVAREPSTALYGGPDGLDFYRTLPALWYRSLKPGGRVAFETGSTQTEAVSALLSKAGYKNIQTVKDLAGLPRAVFAEKI